MRKKQKKKMHEIMEIVNEIMKSVLARVLKSQEICVACFLQNQRFLNFNKI